MPKIQSGPIFPPQNRADGTLDTK